MIYKDIRFPQARDKAWFEGGTDICSFIQVNSYEVHKIYENRKID